jgi:hypothetical protein
MKMEAIIRLVCFIKTKNHLNTAQNFTFQSINYEYNALFSFVFSKLYKQKLCVFCQGHIVIFLVALLDIRYGKTHTFYIIMKKTSSYIKRIHDCVLPYRIYACSDTPPSPPRKLYLRFLACHINYSLDIWDFFGI